MVIKLVESIVFTGSTLGMLIRPKDYSTNSGARSVCPYLGWWITECT